MFSKSFGYALRGILYIALIRDQKSKIQVDEIALQLSAPRHFLSKIMKRLVQQGMVNSTKGPHGGISINDKTLQTPLMALFLLTTSKDLFENCVLRLNKCNAEFPCPLHHSLQSYKNDVYQYLSKTTIGELLNTNQPDYLKSIADF